MYCPEAGEAVRELIPKISHAPRSNALQMCPQQIGASYQIKKLYSVDITTEVSKLCLELSFLYRITDADKPKYEKAQREHKSFQAMADYKGENKFDFAPMVLEVRNTNAEEPLIKERIVSVARMHNGQSCNWYVTLYMNCTLSCKHCFETRHFPFSREFIDANFVCKQPMTQIMFVPFNEVLPYYAVGRKGGIEPVPERRNLNRSDDDVVSNWSIQSHFIHFPLPEDVAPAASGQRYHRFSVILCIEYQTTYILWNIVLVVFMMTALNALVFAVPPRAIADRMALILALLLTMAAYKTAICSELPKKPFLTRIDKHILVAFAINFCSALFLGVEQMAIKTRQKLDKKTYTVEENDEWVTPAELVFVSAMSLAWTAPHLFFALVWTCGNHSRFFMSWGDLLALRARKEQARSKSQEEMAKAVNTRELPAKPLAPSEVTEPKSTQDASGSGLHRRSQQKVDIISDKKDVAPLVEEVSLTGAGKEKADKGEKADPTDKAASAKPNEKKAEKNGKANRNSKNKDREAE